MPLRPLRLEQTDRHIDACHFIWDLTNNIDYTYWKDESYMHCLYPAFWVRIRTGQCRCVAGAVVITCDSGCFHELGLSCLHVTRSHPGGGAASLGARLPTTATGWRGACHAGFHSRVSVYIYWLAGHSMSERKTLRVRQTGRQTKWQTAIWSEDLHLNKMAGNSISAPVVGAILGVVLAGRCERWASVVCYYTILIYRSLIADTDTDTADTVNAA